MKRFRKCAVGVMLIAAIALISAVIAPQPARGDNTSVQQVKVINTTAQPVPVAIQGTPSVAGTVAATQSGPWSVGLASGATVGFDQTNNTVKVANDASNPVVIRDADRGTFFELRQFGAILSGEGASVSEYAVPVGYRLIIEHLSFRMDLPSGQKPFNVAITDDGGDPGFTVQESVVPQLIDDGNVFVANHQTLLMFQGGAVRFVVLKNSSVGQATYTFFVSGRLVPLS